MKNRTIKKILLLIAALLLLSPALHSRSSLDSLRLKLIRETRPEAQLNLRLMLAQEEPNARKAAIHAERAIHIADSLKLTAKKVQALELSGIAWKKSGDYLKSIDRLTEAINYYKEHGTEEDLARIKLLLGETHRGARSHSTGKKLVEEALQYYQNAGNQVQMAHAYNRLAAIEVEIIQCHPRYGHFEREIKSGNVSYEALLPDYPDYENYILLTKNYLAQSNQYANAEELKDILISNLNIEALLYFILHIPDKAIILYDSAIALIRKYNIVEELPLLLLNKASYYIIYSVNPDKAIELALEALKISRQNAVSIYEIIANRILHEAYHLKGDDSKAYDYVQQMYILTERVYNEDLRLSLIAQQYEHQIEINQIELKNRKTRMVIVILSFSTLIILLIIFTATIHKSNRKKKKLLNELYEKNLIISNQNEALAIANRTKDKFFSIIGHDLKNPFNTIMGFSDLLLEKTSPLADPKIKEFAAIIYQSTKKTLGLLNNLLLWARAQSNSIQFQPQKIGLFVIVQEAITLVNEQAKEKNISISVKFDAHLTLIADEEILKTIIRNLLSNAVKYTPQDGYIEIMAEQDSTGTVIRVRDNGIGIDEENLDKIFHLENSHAGRTSSSGLGLLICKELIEKHQGNIWAESIVDEGSTFSIHIPAGEALRFNKNRE